MSQNFTIENQMHEQEFLGNENTKLQIIVDKQEQLMKQQQLEAESLQGNIFLLKVLALFLQKKENPN